MKNIVVLGFAVTLTACAIPQQGGMKRSGGFFDSLKPRIVQPQQSQQQYSVDETIDIVTEPPGARIFVNDAPAGYSPVRTVVHRLWRGDPRYPMTLDTVKIEALPVAAGQCVQSGIFGQASGKTPPQVQFNMTACSGTAAAYTPPAGPGR